jgi:hypothetical protein
MIPDHTTDSAATEVALRPMVRPPYVALCGCVLIHSAPPPQRVRESLQGYFQRRRAAAIAAYESGADWTYDADCLRCNCGDRRSNAPADLPRTGDAEQPKALPIKAQRE